MRYGTVVRWVVGTAVVAALVASLSCKKGDSVASSDSTIKVSANPATLTTGGGDSVITAQVLDKTGYPVSGVGIFFTTSAGSLASNGASVRTNSNGQATDTLSTTTTATVTASSGTLSGTATVTVQ